MFDGLKVVYVQRRYPARIVATQEEQEAVWSLRYRVNVAELQHESALVDHERKWARVSYDDEPGTIQLYVGPADAPVATVAICIYPPGQIEPVWRTRMDFDIFPDIGERTVVRMGSLVALPDTRGTPVAPALICSALEAAAEHGGDCVFIGCAPGLVRSYMAFGMRPYGARHNTRSAASGISIRLAAISNLEHHLELGSPSYHVLKKVQKRGKLVERDPVHFLRAFASASERVLSSPEEIESALSALFGELPTLSVIERMSEATRSEILSQGYVLEVDQDTEVVRSGVRDSELYVVLDGLFEARHGEQVLCQISRGEIFGEVAFFRENRTRAASVVAVTPGRVFLLRRKFLDHLTAHRPADACILYAALAEAMADRIASQ